MVKVFKVFAGSGTRATSAGEIGDLLIFVFVAVEGVVVGLLKLYLFMRNVASEPGTVSSGAAASW